jgi:hypothetical protein
MNNQQNPKIDDQLLDAAPSEEEKPYMVVPVEFPALGRCMSFVRMEDKAVFIEVIGSLAYDAYQEDAIVELDEVKYLGVPIEAAQELVISAVKRQIEEGNIEADLEKLIEDFKDFEEKIVTAATQSQNPQNN